jgi:hypothetical protein
VSACHCISSLLATTLCKRVYTASFLVDFVRIVRV